MVDGKVITFYEYDQRLRFMTLLNAPGDLPVEAEKTLIDDRLRLIAAKRLGLQATDAQILEGMTEFAARANLSAEEFIKALEQNGVAAQTFRDFVQAGLLWRQVIQQKFGPIMRNVPDAQIDRALSIPAQRGVVRVLLSEIIVPASETELIAELAGLRGDGAFGAAARAHSTAPSAAQGGRLDWVPVNNLPPQIVAVLQALTPGQVSPPIPSGDSVAFYQLRAVDQKDEATPQTTAVDYIQYLIPGAGTPAAAAEVARVRALTDACTDIYTIAKGLPEDRLIREKQALTVVPRDIAFELAGLDEGESSARLTRGGYQVLLTLCSRTVQTDLIPNRDAIRERILGERLTGQAEIYLQDLRSNAHIRRP
jgi:peptidyl-prolyl cis-trans isomerase SurA